MTLIAPNSRRGYLSEEVGSRREAEDIVRKEMREFTSQTKLN